MSNLEQAAKALAGNGFSVQVHPDRARAVQAILEEIPEKVSIGRSGSVTCTDLGLYDRLVHRGNPLIDPYQPHYTPEEKDAARKRAQHADIMLTGTNALTLDGKLVNIDGVGNRVSAQIFGPGKVIIVAGRNKVTEDVHLAIRRIKTVSCPQNARRLKLETPCGCGHSCPKPDGCRSPQRMCNVLVIIERQPRLTPISIHLIDEDIGY